MQQSILRYIIFKERNMAVFWQLFSMNLSIEIIIFNLILKTLYLGSSISK